jgi:hypothetical protein
VNEPDWCPRSLADLSLEAYRECEHLAAAATDDYDHLHVDMTPAYSPGKAAGVSRHVAVIRRPPGWRHPLMVVRDRVTTARPGLAVKWLLHTVNEPVVLGGRITASAGEGRLYSVTLLPDAPVIGLVGGPGREFEVAGVNYAPVRLRKWSEPGAWRAEVSRPGEGTRHEFLHVLLATEIGDATEPGAGIVRAAGGAGAGAVAGGAAVVFSGGKLPAEFELPAEAGVLLVLELPPFRHLDLSGPAGLDAATGESGAFFALAELPAGRYVLAERPAT